MKISLRHIEAFKAVVETGSMRRAADVLFISQPAVSKLIASFERAIGFPAFERIRGRLAPTLEGELVYREVERAFVGLHQIEGVASEVRSRKRGRLVVGAIPALSVGLLQEVITRFLAERPNVQVHLETLNAQRLIELVASGRADIAFMTPHLEHPYVDTELMCEVEAVCVLPKNHALASRKTISLEQLDGVDFIGHGDSNSSFLALERKFHAAGIARTIRIVAPATSTAIGFVAQGAGISVVDPFSAWYLASDRFVIRRFRPVTPIGFSARFPADRPRSALALELRQVVGDGLRAKRFPIAVID